VSYTYNQWFSRFFNYVAAVSTATPLNPVATVSSYTDPFWLSALPNVIEYAENRIYREGDFLAERVTDASGAFTPRQQSFLLPTAVGQWNVVEYVNALTPVGTLSSNAIRNQLVPYSRAYVAQAWPGISTSSAGLGLPQVYAMQDASTILLGPIPDSSYGVEVIGTQYPAPLSSANQTTFLTTILPDLFFAATMISAASYMRDWGAEGGDPAMGQSWEITYKQLFASAQEVEARRMYRSAGWTAQQAVPQSTPPRQ